MRAEPAPWSLPRRLAWRLAAVMAAAMLLAALAVGWRAIVTIRSLDDADLQSQARAVASHLIPQGAGVRLALPGALEAQFRYSQGSHLYLVLGPEGQVLAESQPGAAEAILPHLPETGFFRAPAADGRHRLAGLVTRSGPYRIVIAQGHEQGDVLVDSLVAEFLLSGLWLLGPLGLAAGLVAVLTVRHGLRPLEQVSGALRRVGPLHPGLRMPVAGLPRELLPVVHSVNEALDRLERALEAQRRFMSDAAHALRTPLAVLIARLDGLPASEEAEALRADADRISRLVGQLLKMARLEGAPLDTARPVDLRRIAVTVISELAPLAIRRGVELAVAETGSDTAGYGDPAALGLALTNLVENAIAHAPPGSAVEVELSAREIRVLDRGPGVPAAEREQIFRRFQRGQGNRMPGAGLGLAIVAGIAAAHGGSAHVEPREGGGAVFILRLGPGFQRLAPGDHGADQVLPVQPARQRDAGQVQPDQDQNQMPRDVMQVVHPGHAEEPVGLRHPAADAGDQ